MSTTRSFLGAGPGIVAFTLPFLVASMVVTVGWHDTTHFAFVRRPVTLGVGSVLFILGVALYVRALRVLLRAFASGWLVTTGPYGLCRNPMYAAWILLLVPAIGLLLDSWPIVTLSFVAYAGFKLLVGREYLELEQAFGPAYRRYEASVNELLPLPRWRHARHAHHRA